MTDLNRAAASGRGGILRITGMLGFVLFAVSAGAADVPGSRDLDVLTRYPQSQIISFREQQGVERIYPMDGLRRISGRLRMSEQVSAAGELAAITYQLPAAHSGIAALERSRGELIAQGGDLLFWCEGRECGSSSHWANDIFQRSMLYGPEAQQGYVLARLQGNTDRIIALYGITRGNGRAYLHVELFEPEQPLGVVLPTPATLLRQLKQSGDLWLQRLPVEPSPEWVALLANVLRLDTTMRVMLEGEGAATWSDALVTKGVASGRLDGEVNSEKGLRIRLLR